MSCLLKPGEALPSLAQVIDWPIFRASFFVHKSEIGGYQRDEPYGLARQQAHRVCWSVTTY